MHFSSQELSSGTRGHDLPKFDTSHFIWLLKFGWGSWNQCFQNGPGRFTISNRRSTNSSLVHVWELKNGTTLEKIRGEKTRPIVKLKLAILLDWHNGWAWDNYSWLRGPYFKDPIPLVDSYIILDQIWYKVSKARYKVSKTRYKHQIGFTFFFNNLLKLPFVLCGYCMLWKWIT